MFTHLTWSAKLERRHNFTVNLNPFKRTQKEDVEGNFKREAALVGMQEPTTQWQDFQNSLSRTAFMIMDPDIRDFLIGEVDKDTGECKGQLADLLPMFSYMNRLGKLSKSEADLMILQSEYVLMLKRSALPEESNASATLQGLRVYSYIQAKDNVEGFKMRQSTEQIKHVDVTMPKKKGPLG